VILVGGAMNILQTNAGLAEMLSGQLTAVSYDRRGRGGSGDTQPYSVEREIEDLGALIAEVGAAGVFGISTGAILAFESAAAGLPISRLAMLDPPYRLANAPHPPGDYQQRLTELTKSGQLAETVKYFMTAGVGLPVQAFEQLRQSPAWPSVEQIAPTLMYDGLVTGDGTIPAGRMAALNTPALVMNGTGSPPWVQESAAEVAKALGNAQHRTLEGDAYPVPPPVLAPVLAAFFAGNL
jgi:pimeloyl-ACP methyl ester carboxylesterase